MTTIENKKIAQAVASILGDEAMHWVALRSVLGLESSNFISFICTQMFVYVDFFLHHSAPFFAYSSKSSFVLRFLCESTAIFKYKEM